MAPKEESNNRRRLIPVFLILLVVPFLCAATAYAAGLSIDSQWFSVHFGPPVAEDAEGQPPVAGQPPVVISFGGPDDPKDPRDPSGPGNPGDPGNPGNPGNPGDPAASQNCFLGLLCVSASTGSGSGETGIVGVDSNGVNTGEDVQNHDSADGPVILDVNVDDGDSLLGVDLNTTQDLDTGVDVGGDSGLNVDLPDALDNLLPDLGLGN